MFRLAHVCNGNEKETFAGLNSRFSDIGPKCFVLLRSEYSEGLVIIEVGSDSTCQKPDRLEARR